MVYVIRAGYVRPVGHVVRFPPRRVLLLLLMPTYLFAAVLASWAAEQALADGQLATAVAAGVAAVAAVGGCGLVLRAACLRVVLTESAVIAPRLLHGRRTVPLDEIVGIGLRYASAGRGSAWAACVWPAEGRRIRLSIPPPSFSSPNGKRQRPGPGVAPALDWAYVADSPAGRAAIVIARRVAAVQGPNGRWSTMRREEHADIPQGCRHGVLVPNRADRCASGRPPGAW